MVIPTLSSQKFGARRNFDPPFFFPHVVLKRKQGLVNCWDRVSKDLSSVKNNLEFAQLKVDSIPGESHQEVLDPGAIKQSLVCFFSTATYIRITGKELQQFPGMHT